MTKHTLFVCILLLGALPGFAQNPVAPETKLVPVTQPEVKNGFLRRYPHIWNYTRPAPHHKAAVLVQHSGGAGTGSVFATDVSEGAFVVTNHHVVAARWIPDGRGFGDFSVETVRRCNVNNHQALVLWSDKKLDLAVVYARKMKPQHAMKVSSIDPPYGTTLEMVGHGGPEWGFRAFAAKRVKHPHTVLSIDAGTVSGDSGGPMIWNGALVGVNYGGPLENVSTVEGWRVTKPASSKVSGQMLVKALNQCVGQYGCEVIICDPRQNAPQASLPPQQAPPELNPPVNSRQCECDTDQIVKQVAEQLKNDPTLRGPAGMPGERGPAGPSGSPGEPAPESVIQQMVDDAVAKAIENYPKPEDGIGVEKMYADNKGNVYVVYTDQSEHRIGNWYDLMPDDLTNDAGGSSDVPAYFQILRRGQ